MGILTNLQRASVPNIPVLRHLVQWFDAVSGAIDNDALFVASASVDAGATYFGRHPGFGTPIAHPSAGVYVFPFTNAANVPVAIDTPNAFGHVTLTSLPGPVTIGYFTEISFPDTGHCQVRVFKNTAGVISPQDNSFYVSVWLAPLP